MFNIQFIVICAVFSLVRCQIFLDYTPLYSVDQNKFSGYDLQNAKDVSLLQCQISSIHRDSFVSMVRLLDLRLEDNALTNLDADVFRNNKKMVKLNLSWNRFQNIPESIFSYLHELKELLLYKNNIGNFAPKTFENLGQLKKLLIYANSLKAFDENLFKNLVNLEYLHFSDNSIDSLPENIFSNNRNLQILYFHKNQITFLPKNIFKNLGNLKNLTIAFNSISDLDVNLFENTVNLENLWAQNNKISSLNNNLFKRCTKLQFLSLEHNQISKIDYIFSPNSQLKSLYLSNNFLTNIDDSIINDLTSLETLTLDNNNWDCCKIKKLYDIMSKLNSLSNSNLICSNPTHLRNKVWNNLKLEEFSCQRLDQNTKPSIQDGAGELSCDTSKSEDIFWYKNNQLLIGERYKMYTARLQNGTIRNYLHIDDLESSDNGIYKCKVGNNEIQQKLDVPNNINQSGKSKLFLSFNKVIEMRMNIGEKLVTSCQIYNKKPKPTLTWTYNNKEIQDNKNYKLEYFNLDNHFYSYNLTIRNIKDTLKGTYACQTELKDDITKFNLKVAKKLNTNQKSWVNFG